MYMTNALGCKWNCSQVWNDRKQGRKGSQVLKKIQGVSTQNTKLIHAFSFIRKWSRKRKVLDWPNPYESRSSSSKTYSGYGRFCQGKSGSNTPLVGPFQVSKKWNKYFVILFSVKPILLSSNACWQKFKREKREINPMEGTMAGVRSILILWVGKYENVSHIRDHGS